MRLVGSQTSHRGRAGVLRGVTIAATAAMFATMAACGSDNSSSGSSATTTGSTAAATTASTASSATTAATGSSAPATTAAAAAAWDATLAEAKKEGAVTLYMSVPVDEKMFTEAWSKAHPDIELTLLRAQVGDLLPRLEEEQKGNLDGADVAFIPSAPWFEARSAEKALRPVGDGPAAKLWAGLPQLHTDYVQLLGTAYVLAFNTTEVEPFTDPQQLLDPKLSGRIGTLDLTAPPVMAQYQTWADKYGPDFLSKLAAQKPRLYPSTVPMAQDLAAGEIGVAAISVVGAVNPLVAQGAPLDFRVGQDKASLGFSYLAGIVGWSKRPAAASVLMDWLMSAEGTGALASAAGQIATPLAGIPNTISFDQLTIFKDSDWPVDKQNSFRNSWTAMFHAG